MGNCNSVVPHDGTITPEQRVEYLKHTPFFMYLDTDALLNELADCFAVTIFVEAGQKLKDDDSGNMYIVAKGEMELSTVIPTTQRKTGFQKGFLCSKFAGDIVNKKSTEKDAKRRVSKAKLQDFVEDVSLYAKVDSTLMVCNDEKFKNFLKTHESLRPLMQQIVKSDISNYLAPLPFLKNIKESQISLLAAMCKYEAFEEKATLFNQGDEGDKLFIILSGQTDVTIGKTGLDEGQAEETDSDGRARQFRKSFNATKNGELFSDVYSEDHKATESGDNASPRESSPRPSTDDESETFLASMKPGDYFGETALMVNIPRTTTVRTRKKSLFLTIDKVAFQNFLRVCPDVTERMNDVMKDRMIGKLSSMDIPFLQGISPEMFSEFAHGVEMHELDENAVVFKEGDMGDRFYIIIHGEMRVEMGAAQGSGGQPAAKPAEQGGKENQKGALKRSMSMDIGHLGPGKYFGEMALVSHSTRAASVVSNTHAILMSVGADVFHKIFDANPQALCEFKLRCLQEKAELKHILAHPTGLSMFNVFLKKELADENIQFWVAVNNFKKDVSQEAAKELYDKYISESAELQVNVPGKMRKEVNKLITGEGTVGADIFDGSQDEIYKLMVRDNFARFKKTPEFKDFFENLGIFISD
ncbi:hypothetical protein TrRE_jg2152 [Triparma retinervis]|uniref:Uncharacterized protein n=1 Tax=Triparma retinervis TaxID=2557542 RepID=A0A9W7FB34_9STRA|nr:hypothetical protein TrRE_jg2152 [Triparma retinervis]